MPVRHERLSDTPRKLYSKYPRTDLFGVLYLSDLSELPPQPRLSSEHSISINGAKYLELAERSRGRRIDDARLRPDALRFSRVNCAGREILGRTAATKEQFIALDRLAVTIMVTDAEREEVDVGAVSFPRTAERRRLKEA
jgi:hypothetical protein